MGTKRRGLKLAVAVAVVWAASMGGTGTASADIWGIVGTPTDAKWDESTSDVLYGGRSGNVVGFWQGYLESYNHLGNCGITGYWNVPTSVGTQSMQTFLGVPADGVVGDVTWEAAARFVSYNGFNSTYHFWVPAFAADTWAVGYAQARGGAFAGYWYWYSYRTNPSGSYITTASNTVTFTPSC